MCWKIFCMSCLRMTVVQIKCLLSVMTELNCNCYYLLINKAI